LRKILLRVLAIILLANAGVFLFFEQAKFGTPPAGDYLAKLEKSTRYVNGEFQNLEPLPQQRQSGSRFTNWTKIFFAKEEGTTPKDALPVVKTDLKNLPGNKDLVVWFGHSSYFMKLNGKNFLIDPVFSNYASPFFFINRAFPVTTAYTAAEMPEIDYLIITHDHWDHLDYDAITALKPKVKNVICPLGVGGYFTDWDYRPEIIQEGDWYDKLSPETGLDVYFLPARHYSARTLTRNKTLWTAFALITPSKRIFLSGDGGYGSHFKTIGNQFGSFDLALLDTGQYNENWRYTHMNPSDAAQAATDLNAKTLLPIHIGKFSMAYHLWKEPFEWIVKESAGKEYKLLTPKIGEIVEIGNSNQTFSHWWESIR
jgi:L-ascorbate metabolism protein UlaG (beta-lactamase superfamily)